MNLRELNIVNGEYDMRMRYYSIRMKLNDVIKDRDTEQVTLENIRRCSKIVGKLFQIIFWHENLTEQNCKDFVKRNEQLLFKFNTEITKNPKESWFLIGSKIEKIYQRYRFDGDIISGLDEYIRLVNHIKKRDGE